MIQSHDERLWSIVRLANHEGEQTMVRDINSIIFHECLVIAPLLGHLLLYFEVFTLPILC